MPLDRCLPIFTSPRSSARAVRDITHRNTEAKEKAGVKRLREIITIFRLCVMPPLMTASGLKLARRVQKNGKPRRNQQNLGSDARLVVRLMAEKVVR